MTDDDTGTNELPDLPDLSETDEAYVRDLLAALPPVPVPADLQARLDAALRAEAAAGPGPAEAAGPTDAQQPAAAGNVLALDGARRSRPARSTRILQVAAAGVLVVAGGLAVARYATSSPGTSGSASSAGGSAALAKADVVTHSGHVYGDETLVADVRSLATSRTPAPAERTNSYGVDGSTTSQPSPSGSPPTTAHGRSGGTPAAEPSVSASPLFTSDATLVPCLAALEDGMTQPETPLAMDQGTYHGEIALVVVLRGSVDPTHTYDVFVVGAQCGQDADAHLLKYQLVQVR
jgi:hypothetical protein